MSAGYAEDSCSSIRMRARVGSDRACPKRASACSDEAVAVTMPLTIHRLLYSASSEPTRARRARSAIPGEARHAQRPAVDDRFESNAMMGKPKLAGAGVAEDAKRQTLTDL